jgi:hypothetical protein
MVTKAVQNQPTYTLPGHNIELDLFPDRVVVHRKDVLSQLFRGDQTLYFHEIAAVHLYECRFEEHGQLRLDLIDRSQDAIVLDYLSEQHQVAKVVKEAIETALNRI